MVNQQIFELCKRNDARAQRALYDFFKGRLMGLCRRYARNRNDAQDILQEAFIKIFSCIQQVHKVDSLGSWMKSIAVRTAIDHYHKQKRADVFAAYSQDFDVAGPGDEIILGNLTNESLINIVNELPEGCRFVFNLSVVEGYSHAEVSEILGITESTSRSQLHYAKQLLKVKLNRLGIIRYEKIA